MLIWKVKSGSINSSYTRREHKEDIHNAREDDRCIPVAGFVFHFDKCEFLQFHYSFFSLRENVTYSKYANKTNKGN